MPTFNFDLTTVIYIINIVTFVLFGIDKMKAKNKGFRIPEFVLILFTILFGGVGALLGMVVFNHKTSKLSFRIIVPLSFAVNYILSYNSFDVLKLLLMNIINLIPG